MMNKTEMNKINLKTVLILQLAVLFYTLSSVAGKFASAYSFLSFPFIALYGVEIAILGIYAIVWQQIIKRVDLSIAYTNRSLSLMWSMIWSSLFFREAITVQNVIGVIIIIIGVMIVNGTEKEEEA